MNRRYSWAPLALKLAGLSLAAGAASAVYGDHGAVFALGAFVCAVGFEMAATFRAVDVLAEREEHEDRWPR